MNAQLNQFSAGAEKDDAEIFLAELLNISDDVVMVENKRPISQRRVDQVNGLSRKANRNISSIISSIRDEGSALETGENTSRIESRGAISTNNVMQFECMDVEAMDRERTSFDAIMAAKGVKKKPSAERQSSVMSSGVSMDDTAIAELNTGVKKQTWFKLNPALLFSYLLTAILLSGAAVMVYQFKSQSHELEKVLTLYKKSIDNKSVSATESETLKVSKRLEKVSVKKAKVTSVLTPVVKTVKPDSRNEGNKRQKIAVLVSTQEGAELKQSARIIAINTKSKPLLNKPSSSHPVKIKRLSENESKAVKKKTVEKMLKSSKSVLMVAPALSQLSRPTIFAVNLASFSDKNKAIKQLKGLRSDGVGAVMKATLIYGKKVFRISVDGFPTRDKANTFILKIREKYGLEGWVRRS